MRPMNTKFLFLKIDALDGTIEAELVLVRETLVEEDKI